FAGKPVPTTVLRRQPPRRSWLASEGVLEDCARLEALFSGKPAPTEGRALAAAGALAKFVAKDFINS
ncbi:hypothetical protein, partial [Pseudomonas sp. NFPP13]|uniref:hypothetical protein n=1 Tax=Pseudomonas sp. NFPP13 TaxID=1566207 RepID=UPI00195C2FF4